MGIPFKSTGDLRVEEQENEFIVVSVSFQPEPLSTKTYIKIYLNLYISHLGMIGQTSHISLKSPVSQLLLVLGVS